MLYRYETEELQAEPVLIQAQADDLHVQEDGLRYWLSRTTTKDGSPFDHTVTVEEYDGGQWLPVLVYNGDDVYQQTEHDLPADYVFPWGSGSLMMVAPSAGFSGKIIA